ncbi:MAG: hypothetical protein GKR95_25295 [Gammaproteobacteria bacterium]|nr:hypothetical protein [Gammaproteobacteria bacterium]
MCEPNASAKSSLNTRTLSENGKTLVAVTTCSRPDLVRHYLPKLISVTASLKQVDLLLGIDGLSSPGNCESLEFAQSVGVPCVVSEHPEGVGISKNRIVSLLGGYDVYFFLEDDVEVISDGLFRDHIQYCQLTGYHHFSLHQPGRLVDELEPTRVEGWGVVRHAMYGSAQVNFFSRYALSKVGGWHQSFAALRRGGHTEHSYRIFRAQLAPAPFNLIESLIDECIWRDPPAVVHHRINGHTIADNQLYELENKLIADEIDYAPFSAQYQGQIIF